MKLSELSYREYIALEALPPLVGKISDTDAVWRAFSVADAFLKHAGRQNELATHRIGEQTRRAEAAEATVELLRFNAKGQIVPQIALDQIWKFLGVSDQAAAMEVLRQMRFVVPFSTAPLGRETADD